MEDLSAGAGRLLPAADRIFKPFTLVEQVMAGSGEGTGPGLTVTGRLAVLLRGEIEVESAVGEGSTFMVRPPRVGADPADTGES